MTPVDWALTRDLSAPKKLLLVALAWIANDDGSTFKAQKTIGKRVAKDARWVRLHLAELAAEGYISRYRRHLVTGHRTTDLIIVNMPREEPFDFTPYNGIVGDLEPGDRVPSGGKPPQGLAAENCSPSGGSSPGINQPRDQTNMTEQKRAAVRERMPDDFPERLLPAARAVFRVLREVARTSPSAKEVYPREVGLALVAFPKRAHVAVAYELAGNAVDPKRPIKDVAKTYRTYLSNARDLASPERLDESGVPTDVSGTSGNVTPLRRTARLDRINRGLDAARAEGLIQ